MVSKTLKCKKSFFVTSSLRYTIIDEVTSDVTAGQNKMSEKKIALQYACAPAGPVVLKSHHTFDDAGINHEQYRDIEEVHAHRQFNP